METPYQNLLDKINLSLNHVAVIYLRGSRGVGVGTETSDYDYVVITFDEVCIDEIRVTEGPIDFTLMDLKTFQNKVKTNDIGVMECIFSPPVFLNIEDPTKTFVVDEWGLLVSTLRVARARRLRWKNTGQAKHMFIATRYLAYGLELLETGFLKDIKCMNYLWYENNEENQLMEKTFKELMHKAKAAFNELIKSRQIKTIDPSNNDPLQNSPLEVVNYLRNFGLKKLFREKQIEYKRHPEYPNLVQLYYQIFAQTSDIVRECRGIILDESNNWAVVAYPFKRFNLEYKASQVKSIPAYAAYDVYKKYDGSLCILYWYDEKWHVASSHTPDGSAYLCKRTGSGFTLSSVFWKIFESKNFEKKFDKDYTYMFELTIKDHVVVTKEETSLVFLGKRNIKTLEDVPICDCEETWQKPEKINMPEEELLAMLKSVDPRKIEGVILHNPQNNHRIKLKAEGYHRLANLYPICPSIKIASSTKFLLERHGLADFLERCPEHKYSIVLFEKKKQELLEKVAIAYETVPWNEWNHHKYKKMLFDKSKGKDFKTSFDEHPIKYKLDLLSLSN